MKKLLILIVILFVAGCNEAEKQQVWGQGELPADYVSFFGDDNTARLNKAQNDLLNKHEALLHGLNVKNEAGETVHQSGVIDILLSYEARIAALEVEPNEVSLATRVERKEL